MITIVLQIGKKTPVLNDGVNGVQVTLEVPPSQEERVRKLFEGAGDDPLYVSVCASVVRPRISYQISQQGMKAWRTLLSEEVKMISSLFK